MTPPKNAEDLAVATDVSPARWIVDGLHPFGKDVGSVVPAGFTDHARILHPAYAADPDGGMRTVRWSEIAAAKGHRTHPRVQFPRLVDTEDFLNGPATAENWSDAPAQGTLPPELAAALVGVLAGHTSTPRECWFAVWDGFADSAVRHRTTTRLSIPGRELVLLRGPVDAATISLGHTGFQSANLWWPTDRAWCVATDIDFVSTYIGATPDCVDALLHHPDLESFRVDAADPIHYDSDTINTPTDHVR